MTDAELIADLEAMGCLKAAARIRELVSGLQAIERETNCCNMPDIARATLAKGSSDATGE